MNSLVCIPAAGLPKKYATGFVILYTLFVGLYAVFMSTDDAWQDAQVRFDRRCHASRRLP